MLKEGDQSIQVKYGAGYLEATYKPLLWDSGCAMAKSGEKGSLTKNVSLLRLWMLEILRNMSKTTFFENIPLTDIFLTL